MPRLSDAFSLSLSPFCALLKIEAKEMLLQTVFSKLSKVKQH